MTVQFDRVYNLFNRQEIILKSLIEKESALDFSISCVVESVQWAQKLQKDTGATDEAAL